MPSQEIYSKLSIIYNTVMHKVRYDRWSEYLLAVVELYINDNPAVLEIAGGNCNFAGYFIEHFPNIIVTDKSFNMLASSKFKDIPRICCDMTKLPFNSKFDLIYSTFDSVNYLTSKKRLLNLFRGVKTVLKDDGIFTFDVSLERNSILHVEKPVRKGYCDGISFVHRTSYDRKMRIHKNIFKIKIDDDIFTEIHKQKIYPFELYFDLIEKSGMYVAECMETFSFIKASSDSERVQFIVKK